MKYRLAGKSDGLLMCGIFSVVAKNAQIVIGDSACEVEVGLGNRGSRFWISLLSAISRCRMPTGRHQYLLRLPGGKEKLE
jgi:hypothetical protein